MKHFTVDIEDLRDINRMTELIKEFVSKCRLPFPLKVQCTREYADYFAQNTVLVIVSSMALIKVNPCQ